MTLLSSECKFVARERRILSPLKSKSSSSSSRSGGEEREGSLTRRTEEEEEGEEKSRRIRSGQRRSKSAREAGEQRSGSHKDQLACSTNRAKSCQSFRANRLWRHSRTRATEFAWRPRGAFSFDCRTSSATSALLSFRLAGRSERKLLGTWELRRTLEIVTTQASCAAAAAAVDWRQVADWGGKKLREKCGKSNRTWNDAFEELKVPAICYLASMSHGYEPTN